MKKLVKFPLLFALLLAGGLLTGCAAPTRTVVVAGPPRPYYRPVGPYYRPAPIIVRPRTVIVRPGPRYYRPYRGSIRY